MVKVDIDILLLMLILLIGFTRVYLVYIIQRCYCRPCHGVSMAVISIYIIREWKLQQEKSQSQGD